MKKTVILALTALFFGNIAFSQSDEYVETWGIVEGQAKKSDADVANPKKATKIATWLLRGTSYLKVYNFDAENIQYGITKDQIPLIMKTGAKDERTSGDTTIQSFDRVEFYVVGNKVVKYTRVGRAKEFFFPEQYTALDVATEAYMKANELNVDGKKTKTIAEQLKKLSNLYQREALFPYYAKNYKEAAVFFTKAGNIVKTGLTEDTDSAKIALLNNCGEINKAAENYDQAIAFYNDINSIAPSIDVCGKIYYCQLVKKDTASAINTLQMVLDKYANDAKVGDYLNQLIDIYIKTNQIDNAKAYLEKAVAANPNNTAYLFNLGYLSESTNDQNAAVNYYKQAIAIDTNEPNANFNLGRIFASQANDVMKAADALWGKKGYQAKVDEGKSLLKKACSCFEITANNSSDKGLKKNSYFNLYRLYGQLGLMDKSKAAKAEYDAL